MSSETECRWLIQELGAWSRCLAPLAQQRHSKIGLAVSSEMHVSFALGVPPHDVEYEPGPAPRHCVDICGADIQLLKLVPVKVPGLLSSKFIYDLWAPNHGDAVDHGSFQSREEAVREVIKRVIAEEFGYYTLVFRDEFQRLAPPKA